MKDDNKEIKWASRNVGATSLSGKIDPNADLASAVLTRDELSKISLFVSKPQSGVLGAATVGPAGYMGTVVTDPLAGMTVVGERERMGLSKTAFTVGPIGPPQPTREENEELIKKEISSLKRNTMTQEQVLALIEKSHIEKQKQQEETINAAEKQSFDIMRQNFLEGKVFTWRCKCGEILDEFKQEGDIERIKLYLEDFKKGNLKKCQKKGYRNWFELRGGEFVFSESALLHKEFKVPKEKKLDSSQ